MNFCNYCYTRMDACETCKDAIIAEKDKEIARLRKTLERARDFASSHSLPCLLDIVDTLEAKHD